MDLPSRQATNSDVALTASAIWQPCNATADPPRCKDASWHFWSENRAQPLIISDNSMAPDGVKNGDRISCSTTSALRQLSRSAIKQAVCGSDPTAWDSHGLNIKPTHCVHSAPSPISSRQPRTSALSSFKCGSGLSSAKAKPGANTKAAAAKMRFIMSSFPSARGPPTCVGFPTCLPRFPSA